MSRLITTFDEVPPYRTRFTSRSTDLNEEAMVLPYAKRVPPKSFVRSLEMKTEVSKSSRSARTPPSTFLFLHLHLSNSPEPQGLPPPQGLSVKPHSTTNGNRRMPVVRSLIIVRSLRGTKARLGRGPMQRRAQWPGYRPTRSDLSTHVVKKSSHRAIFFRGPPGPGSPGGNGGVAKARIQRVLGAVLNAVLGPQSYDVLSYKV